MLHRVKLFHYLLRLLSLFSIRRIARATLVGAHSHYA